MIAIHLVIVASISIPGIGIQAEGVCGKVEVKFPVKFNAESKQLPI